MVIILLQLNMSAQTSFPLEIGNRWYYQVCSSQRNFYYGAIKEITSSLSNGFKEVTSKYLYEDSITTKKEYWGFINGKFYINTSPDTTYSKIIYNSTLRNDSCVSNGPLQSCIYLTSYSIFDVSDSAQEYSELYIGHGFSYIQKIVSMPNVAITKISNSSGSTASNSRDSTYLVGMYRNGVLIGDTTFIIPRKDTTFFPLNIGSKWYYQISLPYDYNSFDEEVIREVISILDTGFREIKATYFFIDSAIVKKEYWAFQNNKFYISDSPDFDDANICYDRSLKITNCVYKNSATHCLSWSSSSYNFKGSDYLAQDFSYVLGTSDGSIQKYYTVANTLGPVKIMYNTNEGSYYTIERLKEIKTVSTDSGTSVLPTVIELLQNYPNPFNGTTTLSYSLSIKTKITIHLFNVLGEKVKTLLDSEKEPGAYFINVDAANLPSGIYFYQLRAGEFVETKKMVLLR